MLENIENVRGGVDISDSNHNTVLGKTQESMKLIQLLI